MVFWHIYVSMGALGDGGRRTNLEVRVCVNANKVTGVNHGIVGTVHPSSPGIDVANRHAR